MSQRAKSYRKPNDTESQKMQRAKSFREPKVTENQKAHIQKAWGAKSHREAKDK